MIYNVLNNIINSEIKSLGYEIKIIKSSRLDFSDYQSDDCFKLAKIHHKSPMIIGEEIVEKIKQINNFNDYFIDVCIVKPGFINIKISDKLINDQIKLMSTNPKFNIQIPNKKELYFLDYGGPNVAKPLHVGHMRTAIVGESIKRIIEYMGYKTISDVHLGDYGLQIGEVIYKIIEDNKNINDLDIQYLDKAYPEMNKRVKEDDNLKEQCALITKKLQDGDEKYQEYFKKIVEVSVKDIKSIYDYLNVSFDLWLGESDSYNDIKNVEKELNNKKLLISSNGALIVDVKKSEDKIEVPPFIFKKSNGGYLYSSSEIATIYRRIKDYNPNNILYVVDNRQDLHFTQTFRVAKKLGYNCNFEFLGYGTVNGSDNKPYKTRSGNTPKLSNLFEEAKEIFISKKETNKYMSESDLDIIVNSILKFADLQNSRDKDYIFDINKFSETTGKTGPYILYTYLRINKILNKYKFSINNFTDIIYNNYDRDLRIKILDLENAVQNAFINRKPNFIADYIYDLCVILNIFYQNNHISSIDDLEQLNNLLVTLSLANNIIKEMLNLLGIDIPTVM